MVCISALLCYLRNWKPNHNDPKPGVHPNQLLAANIVLAGFEKTKMVLLTGIAYL